MCVIKKCGTLYLCAFLASIICLVIMAFSPRFGYWINYREVRSTVTIQFVLSDIDYNENGCVATYKSLENKMSPYLFDENGHSTTAKRVINEPFILEYDGIFGDSLTLTFRDYPKLTVSLFYDDFGAQEANGTAYELSMPAILEHDFRAIFYFKFFRPVFFILIATVIYRKYIKLTSPKKMILLPIISCVLVAVALLYATRLDTIFTRW